MINIILKGQPKSTQHCYKYACRGTHPTMYMSKECKALKEDYMWQAKSQWNKETLKGELSVIINLFFGTKRKVDWDNFHKLSMDALEGIVYDNDNQIRSVIVTKGYDKENPRITIGIYEHKN